ncbi:EcoKI restriction-modification system protein HsdS [Vibrio thalassae]|uniref:EcoKI restriction-modification system protein HsdS n=1 Tax=Vibrio thalassae TaxID=1243014 RepID=A0A240EJJ8_9VIBR|nr:restriction endonuclease subunit S [Vibrio thalassae]SNX48756.1 EcoKI restriction-modification system protein HsdS [Vibrio thalassae]
MTLNQVPMNQLITDNIDIWTSTVKTKATTGRGSSKKLELYGVKKLRELILELAVRGQLVPQDPNEEPASAMLARVAEEKAQLVKEKKLKKPKKLPNIDEIELPDYTLPLGWKWAFIPEVIAHDNYAIKRGPFGSALKKAFFVASGYKVYEQQHAINDDFLRGEYYVNEKKFEELKAFEVKPFDLIISCSGTVGKVAIAPVNMERGIINQALLKISLNTSALTNEYFKILFPAYYMKTETLSDLQGTAQKNMVSVETLKSEPFPYPPIEEQHRIVAKVDELMKLCDQLEQQTEASIEAHQVLVTTLLDTLTNSANAEELMQNWQMVSEHFDTLFTTEESIEQLKQTVLQLAVMGKLVPQDPNDEPAAKLLERIGEEKAQLIKEKKIKKQKALPPIADDEKLFELANGWCFARFDDICTGITSGSTPPKDKFIESEGVPYLKVYNIRNQEIDFNYKEQFVDSVHHKTKLTRSILYPGDVVMNIVGPPLGKVAIIPDSYPEWNCNQAIVVFRPIEPLLNKYIYTYLTAGLFLQSIELIGTAGQDNISVTKSRSIVLPMPPLEEQHRIVTKVKELMVVCEQLKARLKESQITQLQVTDAIVEQAV